MPIFEHIPIFQDRNFIKFVGLVREAEAKQATVMKHGTPAQRDQADRTANAIDAKLANRFNSVPEATSALVVPQVVQGVRDAVQPALMRHEHATLDMQAKGWFDALQTGHPLRENLEIEFNAMAHKLHGRRQLYSHEEEYSVIQSWWLANTFLRARTPPRSHSAAESAWICAKADALERSASIRDVEHSPRVPAADVASTTIDTIGYHKLHTECTEVNHSSKRTTKAVYGKRSESWISKAYGAAKGLMQGRGGSSSSASGGISPPSGRRGTPPVSSDLGPPAPSALSPAISPSSLSSTRAPALAAALAPPAPPSDLAQTAPSGLAPALEPSASPPPALSAPYAPPMQPNASGIRRCVMDRQVPYANIRRFGGKQDTNPFVNVDDVWEYYCNTHSLRLVTIDSGGDNSKNRIMTVIREITTKTEELAKCNEQEVDLTRDLPPEELNPIIKQAISIVELLRIKSRDNKKGYGWDSLEKDCSARQPKYRSNGEVERTERKRLDRLGTFLAQIWSIPAAVGSSSQLDCREGVDVAADVAVAAKAAEAAEERRLLRSQCTLVPGCTLSTQHAGQCCAPPQLTPRSRGKRNHAEFSSR